ncbi:MAG: DUF4870 domain-containing protein [Candidatus Altiarchaeales archaeon]|nr:DUF4870 domain-containing protein [Candidatus Altiarchaeales archaeon]MBD3416784.1 DUF4870 domain-containing protein [Candidatus Altiarchaeales archaeon]
MGDAETEKQDMKEEDRNTKTDGKEVTNVEAPVNDEMGAVNVETPKTKDSKDDNIIAALAHGLVIVLPVIAPFIIWLVYKDRSRYIRFQSMQALVYQALVNIAFVVLWFIAVILSFVLIGLIIIPVILVVYFAAVVYGLYGAYKTFQGEDFRYPYVGDMVEKNC